MGHGEHDDVENEIEDAGGNVDLININAFSRNEKVPYLLSGIACENFDKHVREVEQGVDDDVGDARPIEFSPESLGWGEYLHPVEQNADFQEQHDDAVQDVRSVDAL